MDTAKTEEHAKPKTRRADISTTIDKQRPLQASAEI
jgi:hypothetical protein